MRTLFASLLLVGCARGSAPPAEAPGLAAEVCCPDRDEARPRIDRSYPPESACSLAPACDTAVAGQWELYGRGGVYRIPAPR